jgi:hypothetical protein
MLKFYHINNKGKNAKSWFILAKDDDDAIRIASTCSGKPDASSLRELPSEDNIDKLCQGSKTGLLAKKLRCLNIKQVMGLEPEKPADPWFIMQEI